MFQVFYESKKFCESSADLSAHFTSEMKSYEVVSLSLECLIDFSSQQQTSSVNSIEFDQIAARDQKR